MKNRIKLLRVERDLSQAQLADALGVARQTIIALEAGKCAPIRRNKNRNKRISN